jgi:hypothetical protein
MLLLVSEALLSSKTRIILLKPLDISKIHIRFEKDFLKKHALAKKHTENTEGGTESIKKEELTDLAARYGPPSGRLLRTTLAGPQLSLLWRLAREQRMQLS